MYCIYIYILILYVCVDTYMCSAVPCGCTSFLACSSCVAHPVADGRSKAATRICIQVEIPTVAWSRCGGWCYVEVLLLLYKFGWVKRWEIVCVCFGKISACLYTGEKWCEWTALSCFLARRESSWFWSGSLVCIPSYLLAETFSQTSDCNKSVSRMFTRPTTHLVLVRGLDDLPWIQNFLFCRSMAPLAR